MTENNEHLDQHTAEFMTKFFEDLIASIVASTEDRLRSLENALESVEKQIATLVVSFGEQAVFTEALVAQLAFASDEARQSFHDTLSQSRKQMLEVMQDASKSIVADENPRVASALTNLATEKLSNTDS